MQPKESVCDPKEIVCDDINSVQAAVPANIHTIGGMRLLLLDCLSSYQDCPMSFNRLTNVASAMIDIPAKELPGITTGAS